MFSFLALWCNDCLQCSLHKVEHISWLISCQLKKFKILKMNFFHRFSKHFNVEEGGLLLDLWQTLTWHQGNRVLTVWWRRGLIKNDSRRNVHEPLNVFLSRFIFGWTFYTFPLKEQANFCVWTPLETLGIESKHVTGFKCELVANSIFKALLKMSWERVNKCTSSISSVLGLIDDELGHTHSIWRHHSDRSMPLIICLQIMWSNGCGPLRPIHQEMWRVCRAACRGLVSVCPPCVGFVAETLSQFNQHIRLTGPHWRINQNKVTLPTICTQTGRDWEVFTSVTMYRKSICTLMNGQTEGPILKTPSLTQIFRVNLHKSTVLPQGKK